MKIADISTGKILVLIGFISAAVLISAAIWTGLDSSFFLGLIFDDAKEFAENGVITSDFMPIGYSGFLGSCIKVFGGRGIPACQSIIYAGVLVAALYFFIWRGLEGNLLTFGIIAVALHPVLVLNVWRIHDGNLTALLIMGFLAACFWYTRFGNIWSILAIGVFAGLLFTVRQNTATLFIIPLIILLKKEPEERINYLGKIVVFLVTAVAFIVMVSLFFKGTPFYFGKHGPYNFFSGANEYSAKYLFSDYSGENSHEEALAARGFLAPAFEERLRFSPDLYSRFAIDYIKERPLEYVKLAGIKLLTLLRPGYHEPEDFTWFSGEALKRILKIILAAPFFVWLYLVYRTREKFFDRENLTVFLVVILYIAPFLIANADPRYRFPIDIVFIADSFCRAKKLIYQ